MVIFQLVDSNVRVKCLGGRELRGALRGYDELVNLVLDDCDEFLRGEIYLFLMERTSRYSFCVCGLCVFLGIVSLFISVHYLSLIILQYRSIDVSPIFLYRFVDYL